MTKNIYSIAVSISLIVICFFFFKTCQKQSYTQQFFNSTIDSLHKERNARGQEITTTKLLYGQVSDLNNSVLSKDSTIQKLRKLVDKHTISSTIVSNETHSNGSNGTTIVYVDSGKYRKDTCKNYIYPAYKTTFMSRWDSGYIYATKDSIQHIFKVKNEFEFRQYYKYDGLLKPRVPVVEVKNNNPNTTTKELKTFTVKPKPAYRLGWFGSGIIVSIIVWAIIHK